VILIVAVRFFETQCSVHGRLYTPNQLRLRYTATSDGGIVK